MFAFQFFRGDHRKDILYVLPALVGRFVCLCVCFFDAAEAGGIYGELQQAVQSPGYPFGLVVTALFLFSGMKRDGKEQVGTV